MMPWEWIIQTLIHVFFYSDKSLYLANFFKYISKFLLNVIPIPHLCVSTLQDGGGDTYYKSQSLSSVTWETVEEQRKGH